MVAIESIYPIVHIVSFIGAFIVVILVDSFNFDFGFDFRFDFTFSLFPFRILLIPLWIQSQHSLFPLRL
jgi:hypothetical protein